MTRAKTVLACPVCGETLQGRFVDVGDAPAGPTEGLEASVNAIPGGAADPRQCRRCKVVYGIADAKIFVVMEESNGAK